MQTKEVNSVSYKYSPQNTIDVLNGKKGSYLIENISNSKESNESDMISQEVLKGLDKFTKLFHKEIIIEPVVLPEGQRRNINNIQNK